MNTVETKLQAFITSGFWIAGSGHFDITVEELRHIFYLIEKENATELLRRYYVELCEKNDIEPWDV